MTEAFSQAVKVYSKNTQSVIHKHKINYPVLHKFCTQLRDMFNALGELKEDDYWRIFFAPIKRLQFGLCAAPFLKEYRFYRISEIIEEQGKHLKKCPKLYPQYANMASELLATIALFLNEVDDPLLDILLKLTSPYKNTAWVIKESRLIPDVEKVVANYDLPLLKILHPLQLKNFTCYDEIIIVGPFQWFPEYIFTAPRSLVIHVVMCNWIKDNWQPQNVFIDLYNPRKTLNKSKNFHETYEPNNQPGFDAESILITTDRELTIRSFLGRKNQDHEETVKTLCVFLEDDIGIFLEIDNKTLVIDFDADKENRIKRIFVKDIEKDMFVLVRTSGGGDYIVPEADKIMGSVGLKARGYQKLWKAKLKDYVERNGLLETSIDLINLGSDIANETNLRNWLSPKSIHTQKYNDFLAIMRLIGLENVAREYWNMMEVIEKAHHKAGFIIRDLLLAQVQAIDIEKIQRLGRVDFKLPNENDIGLTAFRVEGLFSKEVEISYSRIGMPIKLGDM